MIQPRQNRHASRRAKKAADKIWRILYSTIARLPRYRRAQAIERFIRTSREILGE